MECHVKLVDPTAFKMRLGLLALRMTLTQRGDECEYIHQRDALVGGAFSIIKLQTGLSKETRRRKAERAETMRI